MRLSDPSGAAWTPQGARQAGPRGWLTAAVILAAAHGVRHFVCSVLPGSVMGDKEDSTGGEGRSKQGRKATSKSKHGAKRAEAESDVSLLISKVVDNAFSNKVLDVIKAFCPQQAIKPSSSSKRAKCSGVSSLPLMLSSGSGSEDFSEPSLKKFKRYKFKDLSS